MQMFITPFPPPPQKKNIDILTADGDFNSSKI